MENNCRTISRGVSSVKGVWERVVIYLLEVLNEPSNAFRVRSSKMIECTNVVLYFSRKLF